MSIIFDHQSLLLLVTDAWKEFSVDKLESSVLGTYFFSLSI